MTKVLLAMSGGVDSTVAALLLLRQGHDVTGIFMQHPWQKENEWDDAKNTTDQIGIKLIRLDLTAEFQDVVRYFTGEYLAGRTPNPCAYCNKRIKFGRLFEEMNSRGFDFLATGHYIRKLDEDETCSSRRRRYPAICRGRDSGKDQSYIMFGVDRERLSQLLFPVGEYDKNTIRNLAENAGFDFSKKRESQEICFVPDQQHVAFLKAQGHSAKTSGNLVTTDGTVIFPHDGFEQFTIGQRKGMRIGLGGRRYVIRIDADTRDVVVGTREDLLRIELIASDVNWLIEPLQEPFRCQVKIRYRSPAADALVTPLEDHRIHVRFDTPREAIAPGQIAACYFGDRIIGGGWIQ